jgi:hypothetical protein
MEELRGCLTVVAIFFWGAVGWVRIVWLPAAIVAWVVIAKSDTVRAQNFAACAVPADLAYAVHMYRPDLQTQKTEYGATMLQDAQETLRMACMAGRGYSVSISQECLSLRSDAPTPAYCFERSWYDTVAAQVR